MSDDFFPMDILNQFGIQPIYLAAQVVNFLVLLFILNNFLYKPILKVLKTRQEKIAKSLKDAEKIEERLKKTDEEREKVLETASLEGKLLIDEATQAANQVIADAHLKSLAEMEKILEQARVSVRLEKEKMQQEIREELADLVVLGIEKVAGKVLTQKDQKAIVDQTVKQI